MLILAPTPKEYCHKQPLNRGKLIAVITMISILKFLSLLMSSKMLQGQRQTTKLVSLANFYQCLTLTKACKRLHPKDNHHLNLNTQHQALDTKAFLSNSSKKMPTEVYQAKITSLPSRVSINLRVNLKLRMRNN